MSSDNSFNTFQRSLTRIVNRIKSLIRLGSTDGSVSERGGLPLQKVFYLGKSSNSVPLFPYGMHARPKKSWMSVVLSYGGRSENRFHMVTSAERRPTDLKDGEIVFYHPPTMAEIRLKSDGTIEATTKLFKIIGALEVTGDVDAAGDVTAGTISLKTHGTTFTAPDGPTGAPT